MYWSCSGWSLSTWNITENAKDLSGRKSVSLRTWKRGFPKKRDTFTGDSVKKNHFFDARIFYKKDMRVLVWQKL